MKTTLTLDRIRYFETEINRIFNTLSQPNGIKKSVLANILLCELLGIFFKTEFAASKNYPEWLENLLANLNMQKFLKEKLSTIAATANMDQSYVCRAFKKYTGITMSEYLCQVRLHYAANLLQFTDNNIDYISNDVGFLSLAHFNSKFKQYFGQTPKTFRKNSRAETKR